MSTSRSGRRSDRQPSRRTRIRAGIVLAAAAALTVACSSSGPASTPETSAVDTEATLRIGYVGPVPSLDPTQQRLGGEQGATFLLYDRLMQLGNDFEVKPMLATSWEFAPDGSYLELKLREGITFHDGTPVDATAVKASLERSKTAPGSTVAQSLSDIKSVEVIDPTTVRLVLEPGRGAGLPTILTSNAGEIMSAKAIADGRDLALAPGDAGSGPYLVSEFKPNEIVVFERAPRPYWDSDAAKIKRIEIRYMPQASVGLNALRSGQLDMVLTTAADVQSVQKLAETGAVNKSEFSLLTPSHALFMHTDHPAFSDPQVRAAISQAIDREAICRDLLAGNCDPRIQPYASNHWAYVKELDEQLTFTPEQAQQTLADAGVAGVRFPLVFTAGSSYESVAQVVQSQLAQAGITVDLMPLPSAEAFTGFREGRYPAYLTTVTASAEPSQLMDTQFLGGYNAADAIRDVVTPIAEQADKPGLSREERAKLYGQIWAEVNKATTLIPIISNKVAWAYSPKVHGVDEMPWSWSGGFELRYLTVTR
ncbi:peptide/nickel transport system substrate-binding protein [Pseudonocardia thermophila]|jgi:ABC-type dipeptide transport system, periplasmic component|uniref:Peptide/nickel transport system substrate-binding protein n=1 Tax=Pseudonocardia thermophila TaxID=1848 RepID=A0A1M6XQD5_PSETH|nr:ABC transporter substrate-binding protein [Pseudonocardia thermophila]SHL08164.1 peptide/nickel transport system substrate-binding protein [Pseudonocardia thermophila]